MERCMLIGSRMGLSIVCFTRTYYINDIDEESSHWKIQNAITNASHWDMQAITRIFFALSGLISEWRNLGAYMH